MEVIITSTLRVYFLSRLLVRGVHELLPRITERSRDLADQVDRSSRSTAAYGSARETRAHLEMAVDVRVLRETEASAAIDLADHVAASLYTLLRNRAA